MSRPKGAKGNPFGIRKERWNPVKWRVDHEAVVLMHVNGKSNKEIAEICEKSEMWVSLIINSPRAGEVIEGIRKRLPHGEISERYKAILDKATSRMEKFLDDGRLDASPFAAVDRAMRMAEMIDSRLKNVIKEKETERITERTVVLASESAVDKMLHALERSQKVTELHRMTGNGGGTGTEIKLLRDGTDG